MHGLHTALRSRRMTRRAVLSAVGGGALALALTACRSQPNTGSTSTAVPSPTRSSGQQPIMLTPAETAPAGTIRTYTLEAGVSELALGSQRVRTFVYNGQLPGPELRVREGETLRVELINRLPEPTTIHWHGIPVPNAQDGVPDVTQPAVAPGARFVYEFVLPVAGTYFFHPHVGLQLDRGLYGALIVEPRQESLSYDREYTLLLDDWLDGIRGTPEDAFQQLVAGGHSDHAMGHGMGHGMGTMPMTPGMNSMPGMGGMPGMGIGEAPVEIAPDLVYPVYLINGRPPETPFVFTGKRGEVLRLRVINAASATIFRVALLGHRLTVTHADGHPVEPLTGDVLQIGMGERYDVLVRLEQPGVWPLVAWAEGTELAAQAVLRYEGNTGQPPLVRARPRELAGELLHALRFATATPGTDSEPAVDLPIVLGGGMGQYVWTMNGQAFPQAEPIALQRGQRVRFRLQNMTTMPHPMHLHGHVFRVGDPARGAVRDTVLVHPMQALTIDWVADNPGQWAFHCHHLYHQEAGMMRLVTIA